MKATSFQIESIVESSCRLISCLGQRSRPMVLAVNDTLGAAMHIEILAVDKPAMQGTRVKVGHDCSEREDVRDNMHEI